MQLTVHFLILPLLMDSQWNVAKSNQVLIIFCNFLRGMTSEDLKLREKAPKGLHVHDKTLPKVNTCCKR